MKKKHLISTENLSKSEILSVFSTASNFKSHFPTKGHQKLTSLQGKTIVNLFVEPSTRTRVGFETAAKQLSADVINIESDASSLTKGESLRDTALTIQALNADAIVLRHPHPGASQYISKIVNIPVINAGDGAHEHPTQGLLDAFTLIEHFGCEDLTGKKITILGDILFSRVARSNIHLLQTLGAEVTLTGPNTLIPDYFNTLGPKITYNLQEGLKNADAVILLRIQHERQSSTHFPSLGEYTRMFGINKDHEHWLKKDAAILHPGPINRGVEIDAYMANSPKSLILNQVSNGIYIRMATLYLAIAAASEVDVHEKTEAEIY